MRVVPARAVVTLLTLWLACLLGLTVTPAHAQDPPLPNDLTAVAGRATVSQAPTITSGRYLDHVRPLGDPNIYLVHRTIPGSAILFGATLLRQGGLARQNRLTLTMAYTDPSAPRRVVRCGSNAPLEELHTSSTPLDTHAGFTIGGNGCAGQRNLYLVVRASRSARIPYRTPYELDVWEIPPVTNAATLPGPGTGSADVVEPQTPALQVVPGPWPSQAASLTPNRTVHVDLPLGKVAYFAVDVPFDDLVDAIAAVEDPRGTSVGSTIEMSILSPVGGLVAVPPLAGASPTGTATIGAGPASVEVSTALVNPAARIGQRNDTLGGETTLSSQPGWYVIAVYVPNHTTSSHATLPMTLTPGLRHGTGSFAQGDPAPTYAAKLVPFPAPNGPVETPYSAEATATPAASSTGSGHTSAAYGLAGGAAVLMVIGVGVLLVSRRGWLS